MSGMTRENKIRNVFIRVSIGVASIIEKNLREQIEACIKEGRYRGSKIVKWMCIKERPKKQGGIL